jgi:hypothetical protein
MPSTAKYTLLELYDVHYLQTTHLFAEMFHICIDASRTQGFSMIMAEPNHTKSQPELEPFKIQSFPLARTPPPDLAQLYS